LLIFTEAFGTAAPLASVTWPCTPEFWAKTAEAVNRITKKIRSMVTVDVLVV
jgi:hypothetical protein